MQRTYNFIYLCLQSQRQLGSHSIIHLMLLFYHSVIHYVHSFLWVMLSLSHPILFYISISISILLYTVYIIIPALATYTYLTICILCISDIISYMFVISQYQYHHYVSYFNIRYLPCYLFRRALWAVLRDARALGASWGCTTQVCGVWASRASRLHDRMSSHSSFGSSSTHTSSPFPCLVLA